jgi:hypothetical protein
MGDWSGLLTRDNAVVLFEIVDSGLNFGFGDQLRGQRDECTLKNFTFYNFDACPGPQPGHKNFWRNEYTDMKPEDCYAANINNCVRPETIVQCGDFPSWWDETNGFNNLVYGESIGECGWSSGEPHDDDNLCDNEGAMNGFLAATQKNSPFLDSYRMLNEMMIFAYTLFALDFVFKFLKKDFMPRWVKMWALGLDILCGLLEIFLTNWYWHVGLRPGPIDVLDCMFSAVKALVILQYKLCCLCEEMNEDEVKAHQQKTTNPIFTA